MSGAVGTPEKALEKAILDWLNILEGCFAFKLNNTGVYDPKRRVYRKPHSVHIHKGVPDILGVYKGQFFAIEVKAGYNKASTDQKKFIERLVSNGGFAWITNDVEQCKQIFVERFGSPEYATDKEKGDILFKEIL